MLVALKKTASLAFWVLTFLVTASAASETFEGLRFLGVFDYGDGRALTALWAISAFLYWLSTVLLTRTPWKESSLIQKIGGVSLTLIMIFSWAVVWSVVFASG